jgi:hypothetical protein
VSLTADIVGGSGDYAYSWSAAGGSFPDGSTGQTVTWQAPADALDGQQFAITLEVTDNQNGSACSGATALTTTVTIAVPQPAIASVIITPDHKTLDVGQTQDFTAQAYDADNNPIDGGVTYDWSVSGPIGNAAPLSDSATTTFTATTVGTGTVNVTATIGDESVSAQAPVVVVEALSCTDSFIIPADFAVVPGGTRSLTAHPTNGSGDYTYSWSAAGGSFPDGDSGQTVTWQAPVDAARPSPLPSRSPITPPARPAHRRSPLPPPSLARSPAALARRNSRLLPTALKIFRSV